MSITYRGVTLTYAWHTRGITQRAKKEIVFPGVNGITVQEMGERGRNFQIKGRITDISEVTFNPEIIEGWQDGSTGTLVIHGTSFTNCQVENGSGCGNFYKTTDGNIGCEYNIEFKKLV